MSCGRLLQLTIARDMIPDKCPYSGYICIILDDQDNAVILVVKAALPNTCTPSTPVPPHYSTEIPIPRDYEIDRYPTVTRECIKGNYAFNYNPFISIACNVNETHNDTRIESLVTQKPSPTINSSNIPLPNIVLLSFLVICCANKFSA